MICLVRGMKNESYTDFGSRIEALCRDFSVKEGVQSISAVYTAFAPPAMSVIPFRKSLVASISLKGVHSGMAAEFAAGKGFAGVFLVDEAIPVAYERNWPDGEPTPGVNLLTLFHKKPGISREYFLDRWHNSHTPLSLRIHPLWNYNRNVVLETLSEGSEPFDGIVEEHFRSRADLVNPFRFFGPPHKILRRMAAVYTDTKAFLDYRRIEVYFAVEIHIKSSIAKTK